MSYDSKTYKIQKIEKPIVRLPKISSFGVIGDPGCDGLGVYNMGIYAAALEQCSADDFTLILGDLVPYGSRRYYDMICSMTETLAENSVFALRGNHDIGMYGEYFGLKNYAVLADDLAVIVIDNATRSFEEEGLKLLSETLAMNEVKQAVIAFHIPVPNRYIMNCVSDEQFAHLIDVCRPYKYKIKYLLCGHVHSRFTDEVDGIPLICSGGGGAIIEDINCDIRACDVKHHTLHFYFENGELRFKFTEIEADAYTRERYYEVLKTQLTNTVVSELTAHLRYSVIAAQLAREGKHRAASLFRALSASEFYHAGNFFAVLEGLPLSENTTASLKEGETFEYSRLYKMMQQYAEDGGFPLALQAYRAAAEAERVHAALLSKTDGGEKLPPQKLYVCPTCGYLLTSDSVKERCPVCGTPRQQFEEY